MNSENDKKYMRKALTLAKLGNGFVNPNPLVGAVIVKEGEVVGEGYHRKFGGAHAEVEALKDAGESARGGAMYVTLEPCTHKGKRPPCAPKIVNEGIDKVFVAVRDPNPDVNGSGIEELKQAGVEVSVGLLKQEAKALNEIYFHYVKTGRPFVLLKLAMTMDGKIATKTGDSRWISSNESREYVHQLRARYSGVCVGVNTIISDNPQLTARKADGPDGARFVLDNAAETPPESRVLSLESKAPTVILVGDSNPAENLSQLNLPGVKLWPLPERNEKIDLEAFLNMMGEEGYDSLLVEGGSEVAWSFLQRKLVDKLLFFYSPKIIGGADSVPAVGGKGKDKLRNAFQIQNMKIKRFGPDFSIVGYPAKA